MAYGETVFTLTNLIVAAWDGANYGAPVTVGHRQKMNIEPQFDTDTIKAGGMMRAALSVATHNTFTLEYAKLQSTVLAVIAGETPSTSGVTPSQKTAFGLVGGGAGMPYFGVIGVFASEDGGNILVGLPLCKLDKYPAMGNDQNQFAVYSVSGTGIANEVSSAPSQLVFFEQNETAATAPADAAAVDTFFGIS
jgi:hypothetical protein